MPVSKLQNALLRNETPAAVVPLFNLSPDSPEWLYWQQYYLQHPEAYPTSGNCPISQNLLPLVNPSSRLFQGTFHHLGEQEYTLTLADAKFAWKLVTLRSHIDEQLQICINNQYLTVRGTLNYSGKWLLVEEIEQRS